MRLTPRRLAVGAQHLRFLGLRAEPRHDPVPEQPRRPQLGHLHEEVHADAEEEAEPRREGVDVEPLGAGGADIVHAVGEREGQLLDRGRAGLVHMVARDRDRVELRHVRRAILDDVGDDPHRGRGRVDIGVADRELLQDVVLDGAGELVLGDALLLRGDDVEGHHRQDGAVHRHRDRHLVERDAVEQDLHVLERVDRHPRLADVADHAGMVAVIAAMGGEIEGDARGPSARRRGCGGRRRSNPRRSRSPHIGGSSRAGRCTSRHRARA